MSELIERVERIETDLYSTAPDEPGLALRMDRVERLMKLVTASGVLAVLWQLFQLLTALAVKGAIPHPPG